MFLGPDWIEFYDGLSEKLKLRRYYKNDWEGIGIIIVGMGAQVFTLDCRTVTDKIDEAISILSEAAFLTDGEKSLTDSEKEGLRVALSKCWNVGGLSSEALRTTVVVAVSLSREGKPETGSFRTLSYEGGSETAANQAYESARQAFIRCGAKGFNLPSDKYSQWQDIEMTFNPENSRFK